MLDGAGASWKYRVHLVEYAICVPSVLVSLVGVLNAIFVLDSTAVNTSVA